VLILDIEMCVILLSNPGLTLFSELVEDFRYKYELLVYLSIQWTKSVTKNTAVRRRKNAYKFIIPVCCQSLD